MRNSCKGAWKLVIQGQLTATTSGVDIPVLANIPATDHLYVYAVDLTNAGAQLAYYVEPAARGGTAAHGIPLPDTTSNDGLVEIGSRDLQDVIDNGNPQVRTAASTCNVRYRLYVKSR